MKTHSLRISSFTHINVSSPVAGSSLPCAASIINQVVNSTEKLTLCLTSRQMNGNSTVITSN